MPNVQTGDPAHRETLLAAGRLADDIDAVDVLVGAALRNNRGWNSNMGTVDRDRVEMCRRALVRLGDADSPDRARLISLLCVEGTWDADIDERLSMAKQAVGIARRTGDRAALVDAIRLCYEAITMPQTLELRRRWDAEACDLADDLGDPIARLHVNLYRCADRVGGRRPRHDARRVRHLRVRVRAGRTTAQPVADRLPPGVAAERSMATLDAAEQAATEALTVGTAAGYPDDALTVYGGQIFTVRWMQGRLGEMVPLIEEAMRDNPGLRIFHATLAAAMSFDEPAEKVRQFLDTEITNGFTVFDDASWLAAQVLWAQAVARSGHRPGSKMLYERLLPWHDQFATTHITVQRGSRPLPRDARPHPRPPRRSRPMVREVGRAPRGDGSAVLRRVDPD